MQKAGNGLVVEPGSVKSLQHSLDELLTNGALRRIMAERSRRFSGAFDADIGIKAFTHAVSSVLKT